MTPDSRLSTLDSLPSYLKNQQICTVDHAIFLKNCTTHHAISVKFDIPQFADKTPHHVTSSPVSDFEIDGMTFEIGGKNKSAKQLAKLDYENAYIVKDDIEHPALHHIPLWMFGFLY